MTYVFFNWKFVPFDPVHQFRSLFTLPCLWQVTNLFYVSMRLFTYFCGSTLEKEMATHSSILAWRIPWTNLVGYSSWVHMVPRVSEHVVFVFLYLSHLN